MSTAILRVHLVHVMSIMSCGLGTVQMVTVRTLSVRHYLVARALSAQHALCRGSRRSVWPNLWGMCLVRKA